MADSNVLLVQNGVSLPFDKLRIASKSEDFHHARVTRSPFGKRTATAFDRSDNGAGAVRANLCRLLIITFEGLAPWSYPYDPVPRVESNLRICNLDIDGLRSQQSKALPRVQSDHRISCTFYQNPSAHRLAWTYPRLELAMGKNQHTLI